MRTLWKSMLPVAVCALLSAPAWAQKKVSVFNGKASLVPPAGFQALSRIEIKRRFPNIGTPQFAWSDKTRSTVVALTMSNDRLTPAQIPQLKQFMEKFLPQFSPGLRWVKRETIMWQKRQWVHMEFVGQVKKKMLYNDLYFTSHYNRVFGLVLNTPASQRAGTQPLLTRCRRSLLLRS